MNEIRTWTASICCCVLAVSLIRHMVPPGSMEKMIRYVTGIFLVCAVVYSFHSVLPNVSWIISFDFSKETDSSFSDLVKEQEISAAEESIRRLTATELAAMGMEYKNIQVDMDKQRDGSISINRIRIWLQRGYEGYSNRVTSELKEKFEVYVEVVPNEE